MDSVIHMEDYYNKKIEDGELLATCLNTIADVGGVYLKKNYVYQVIDMTEDCWFIEGKTVL